MSFIPLDFPREVLHISTAGGLSGRKIVRSPSELEKYWEGKSGISNAYFTVYGYQETQPPKHHRVNYDTPIVHHFMMDFDCKDFKTGFDVPFNVPHEEVKRLHQYLLDENIEHYVWFSGGGFHLWIKLAKTHKPIIGIDVSRIKNAGRYLINQWDKKLNLRCNDPAVFFEFKRMIRIPNSYNAKRGVWMIPLNTEQIMNYTYDDFMKKGQEPHTGFILHGNKPLELDVNERKIMSMGDIKQVDVPTVSLKDIHILPCIAHAAMGEGNPPHRARVHFASYLADRLRFFFPHYTISKEEKEKHIQQIAVICAEQGWVDYNPIKTKQQVRSIVERGYNHANCATLYAEGFCLGKCKYYDETGDIR